MSKVQLRRQVRSQVQLGNERKEHLRCHPWLSHHTAGDSSSSASFPSCTWERPCSRSCTSRRPCECNLGTRRKHPGRRPLLSAAAMPRRCAFSMKSTAVVFLFFRLLIISIYGSFVIVCPIISLVLDYEYHELDYDRHYPRREHQEYKHFHHVFPRRGVLSEEPEIQYQSARPRQDA